VSTRSALLFVIDTCDSIVWAERVASRSATILARRGREGHVPPAFIGLQAVDADPLAWAVCCHGM